MSDAVRVMFDTALTKRPREFREMLDTEIGKRVYEKINGQYKATYIDDTRYQDHEMNEQDLTEEDEDEDEDDDDFDFDMDDEDDEDDEDDIKEQVEAIERKTRGDQSVALTKSKGMLSQTRDPAQRRFTAKHHVSKTEDRNGNGDDVFNASNVGSVERQPMHGYNPGEDEVVYERELTPAEIKQRDSIADSMLEDPGTVKDFKKRYGADWKSVMMGVATKQAKK